MKLKESHHIRGILSEFGIIIAVGYSAFFKTLPAMINDSDLPVIVKTLASNTLARVKQFDESIIQLEKALKVQSSQNEIAKRVMTVPGVGLLTATYLVASVGDET